jgi:hypothetical protein
MFDTAHVIFIEDESKEQEICKARMNDTLMFKAAPAHHTQIQMMIARSHIKCRKTEAVSEGEQRLPCTPRLHRKSSAEGVQRVAIVTTMTPCTLATAFTLHLSNICMSFQEASTC